MNHLVRTGGVLPLLLAASLAGRTAAADPVVPGGAEDLLPADTLLYFGVEDVAAFRATSNQSVLGKIMGEEEVQDFLEKPMGFLKEATDQLMAMAKSHPAMANTEIDLDKILSGAYGRTFAALTHITLPFEEGSSPIPDVGLVIGCQAQQGSVDLVSMLRQVITAAAASETGQELTAEAVSVGEQSFEQLSMPGMDGVALCFADIGGMSVMSTSPTSMKGVLRRAQGEGTTLASATDFASASKSVGSLGSSSMMAYVDVGELMSLVRTGANMAMMMNGEEEQAAMVNQMFDMMGLESMGASMTVSGWEGDSAVTRSFVAMDPQAGGVAAMMGGKPIRRELMKVVPKNALSFSIMNLELAPIYSAIMDGIKSSAPDVYEMVDQQIRGMSMQISGADADGNPNWDLKRDLIDAVGGECLIISEPGPATMLGAGAMFTMAIDVTNPQGLEKTLNNLLQLPGMMADMPLNVKEETENGVTIKTLDMMSLGPAAMVLGTLTPCWTIHDGKFVFSLSKRSLTRLLASMANPPEESIAAKKDFARYASKMRDAELMSVSYGDTASNFENAYSSLVGGLQMAMMTMAMDAEDELPIDLAMLPTAEAVSQHLFGSVNATYKVEGGYLTESYGPIGADAMMMAAGAMVLGVGVMGVMESGNLDMPGVDVGGPVVAAGPEADARATVKDLQTAILIYEIVYEKPPKSLDELVTPRPPDYPDGIYEAATIPMDPWGNQYIFDVDAAGSWSLYSAGPNGQDDKGGGDDIVE